MRKLLLLCAMLLSIVGAYGITYPKEGVAYTIKNVYGFYHSAGNYRHYMIANSEGSQLTGTGSLTSENLDACQWVFEKADNADNAYYLKNYKTNKYVCLKVMDKGQVVSLEDASQKSALYLFEGSSEKAEGEYFISFKNNNVDDSIESIGIHGNADMKTWQGNGLGNQWVVEEVPPVYTIEGGTSSQHRGFLAAGEGFTAYPVLSDIAWSDHDEKSTAAISGGKYWYIHKINDDNTYVLFNLGLQKYLVLESDKINFGDYPYAWKIVQNTSDSNYKAVCLWNGTKQISFACGYTAAQRNVIPNNQMGDGGSKHLLKCVLPADLTEFSVAINKVKNEVASLNNVSVPMTFKFTDNGLNQHSYTGAGELYPLISGVEDYVMQTPVWNGNTFNADITFPVPVSSETVSNPTFISTYNYSEQLADQFKWYASDDKIKVKEGEEIFYSSIASHLWLIYPKFNNGAFTFQIKNVATDSYINSSFDGNGHDDESTVVLSSEATDFTVGKRGNEGAEFINSFEKRLSVNTSKPDPADKIQTVGTHGSHYGTAVTFPDYMESTTWPEFVSTGTTLNPLVIAIDNDAKKALVAKKLPSSADRYVHVTASNEEPELGYGQWTIYPAFSGNKIGFKIKNIATDTYIYAKPNGASEEYPVVLNADGTAFDFADSKFAYTDGVNTLYLSVPTNESFNLPLGVSTGADDTRKTIAFPEFSSFQVTIGEVGYTTLYSPFTVFAFPEEGKEVDIYAITDATTSENNKVTLTKLESWDVIPANQGCILKGSGKITFSKTDDTWVSGDWSTNLLRGSFTNTYVEGDAYVLSAPNGVESVGLYKALLNKDANGEAGTSHFKNNAGKAYLPASALSAEAAESRFFVFSFGDDMETGITETENGNVKTENTEVYDLAGRRVQGAQKGIFIVNGKKVVR